ncbi:MAG: DUF4942 domain-containing protein [Desulfosalsimonadaceae bacterium]
MYIGTTLPIKQITAERIITLYQEADKNINQAFDLLISAKRILSEAVGNNSYYNSILPRNMNDYDLEREKKSSREMVKRNVWRAITEKCQIKEMMAIHEAKNMDEQLEKGTLPEITIENLHDFLKNLGDSLPDLINKAVVEVFTFLTPQYSGYKTNQKPELGERAILSFCVNSSGVSYHRHQYLQALDNVFHLLDGKGIAKHPFNLPTLIDQEIRGSGQKTTLETGYFSCKWFKNGNLHLKFKRMDLVQQINAKAGENRVKI